MEKKVYSIDEALELNEKLSLNELCELADTLRKENIGDKVHTCSIVNARSGLCGEDCKWCAQSKHYTTGCKEYPIVNRQELIESYDRCAALGVQRFSLVTSGRRVTEKQLPEFIALYKELNNRGDMELCASMGLLTKEQLQELKNAGVTRYHCNLEAADSYFPALCTTHTRQDKLNTINAAKEAGLQVCVGGIIGMGETMRQRLELILECRALGPHSIPVNVLNPIAGTPLGTQPLLSEEEVVRTVALMRLVAPDCDIFFAGGRARISREATSRMLRGGVNGALVGNMLTTIGNDPNEDFKLFESLGYNK